MLHVPAPNLGERLPDVHSWEGQGLQQRWLLDGSREGFGSGNPLKVCSQKVGALGPRFAERARLGAAGCPKLCPHLLPACRCLWAGSREGKTVGCRRSLRPRLRPRLPRRHRGQQGEGAEASIPPRHGEPLLRAAWAGFGATTACKTQRGPPGPRWREAAGSAARGRLQAPSGR